MKKIYIINFTDENVNVRDVESKEYSTYFKARTSGYIEGNGYVLGDLKLEVEDEYGGKRIIEYRKDYLDKHMIDGSVVIVEIK